MECLFLFWPVGCDPLFSEYYRLPAIKQIHTHSMLQLWKQTDKLGQQRMYYIPDDPKRHVHFGKEGKAGKSWELYLKMK